MSHKLPDKGESLKKRRKELYERLDTMKNPPRNLAEMRHDLGKGTGQVVLASKKGLTIQAKALTHGAVEHLHT